MRCVAVQYGAARYRIGVNEPLGGLLFISSQMTVVKNGLEVDDVAGVVDACAATVYAVLRRMHVCHSMLAPLRSHRLEIPKKYQICDGSRLLSFRDNYTELLPCPSFTACKSCSLCCVHRSVEAAASCNVYNALIPNRSITSGTFSTYVGMSFPVPRMFDSKHSFQVG